MPVTLNTLMELHKHDYADSCHGSKIGTYDARCILLVIVWVQQTVSETLNHHVDFVPISMVCSGWFCSTAAAANAQLVTPFSVCTVRVS